MKTDLFQSCGHCWVFQICWHMECSTFTAPSLRFESPPGSSVHGILQARILEWVAMPFSRGSSQPRDQTQVSSIAGGFFTIWATQKTLLSCLLIISSISASSYCGIPPFQPVDCTALLLVLPCSPGVSPPTVWLEPLSFTGCPSLAIRCTLFSQSPLSTIQILVFHIWRPLLFSGES